MSLLRQNTFRERSRSLFIFDSPRWPLSKKTVPHPTQIPKPGRPMRGAIPADPPADLRGAVQLATDGTREAPRLVEGLHATVQSVIRPGTPTGRLRTTGLTGWIYQTVRQTTEVPGTVQPGRCGASGSSGPPGIRHRGAPTARLGPRFATHPRYPQRGRPGGKLTPCSCPARFGVVVFQSLLLTLGPQLAEYETPASPRGATAWEYGLRLCPHQVFWIPY